MAIQRQLERDRLRELIDDAEAEHGPMACVAVEAKRAVLRATDPSVIRSDACGAALNRSEHPGVPVS